MRQGNFGVLGWTVADAARASRYASLALALICGAELVACSGDERDFGNGDAGNGGNAGSGTGGTANSGGRGEEAGAGGEAGTPPMPCSTAAECPEGNECCDGFCIDTSANADHCGGCGEACSIDNAEASCAAAECGVGTCNDGYADCNSLASDGCETEDVGLPSVPAVIAPIVGAYTGSVHAEASLKPTFTWKSSTEKGTCGSLSYEIQLTTECTPGQLQSCAFADPVVDEKGLTATTWTPSSPLDASTAVPAGDVYFWRVRACETETRCSDWSPVRYVNVGRLRDDLNGDGYSDVLMVGKSAEAEIRGMFFVGGASPPISAAETLGTEIGAEPAEGRFLGDVNGDGFQDAVVWSYDVTAEIPRVILGSAGLDAVTVLSMSDVLSVSHAAGGLGDFDADGFADVAIAEYHFATPAGTPRGVVHLYHGSASFALESPTDISPPEGTTAIQFGRAVEGGMDMNRDGYADFAILDGDDKAIYLFEGGIDVALEITETLAIPHVCNLSYPPSTMLAAGDMTGDGYEELAAFCTTSEASSLGNVVVFRGGNPPPSAPMWQHIIDTSRGSIVAGGRDLGSDGLADLIYTTEYGSGVPPFCQFLIQPGSVDTTTTPDSAILGSADDYVQFSVAVTIGDYDGDGAWDVLLTAAEYQGTSERQWLLGGKSGTDRCTATPHQLPESYEAVGDWCTAETGKLYEPSEFNYGGLYAR